MHFSLLPGSSSDTLRHTDKVLCEDSRCGRGQKCEKGTCNWSNWSKSKEMLVSAQGPYYTPLVPVIHHLDTMTVLPPTPEMSVELPQSAGELCAGNLHDLQGKLFSWKAAAENKSTPSCSLSLLLQTLWSLFHSVKDSLVLPFLMLLNTGHFFKTLRRADATVCTGFTLAAGQWLISLPEDCARWHLAITPLTTQTPACPRMTAEAGSCDAHSASSWYYHIAKVITSRSNLKHLWRIQHSAPQEQGCCIRMI